MPWSRSERCMKYCSIIGAHFMVAPVSFIWVYGNLSAYMDSYFRFACAPDCMDGDSQWIVGLCLSMVCPGTFVTKYLADKVGLKFVGVVSAVVLNVSLFACAWTVNLSVAWTTVLLGIVMGLVQGVSSCIAFQYASGWAPERAALLMATTSGASTFISVPQNQIITAVVNPHNLKPDVMQGSRRFFSQPEVLDRVPKALLAYAAMTLGLQLVGCKPPLLRVEREALPLIPDPLWEMDRPVSQCGRKGYLLLAPREKPFTVEPSESALTKETQKGQDNGRVDNGFTQNKPRDSGLQTNNSTSHDVSSLGNEEKCLVSSQRNNDDQMSLTPRQVLQLLVFYAVFTFGLATLYAFSLKSNYYKQFGLVYIHNDHYLTLVGTFIPIVASVSRFLLGLVLNLQLFTIKDVIIFSLALNTVLCAFWYIVPQVNADLYMFLVLCLAVVQSMVYLIMPVVALQRFGPSHFSTNYGMLLMCIFIVGILSPAVASPLLRTLGWSWLFASASIFCFLTLMTVVCIEFNPTQPSL
ncbi:oxalate:formate antiporter [Elysia marginata]|uniref:Oxalate:formate antiporter n=1 Tax=Elysia marginata TaxID=1093978 RepID=A0AAV4JFY4_9GAST|nr:oxalate:formate antiporter [Elysia marginata]